MSIEYLLVSINIYFLPIECLYKLFPPPLLRFPLASPPRISRSLELIINISRLIKHLIDHSSACVTHNTPLQYFLSWRLELVTKVNEIFTITEKAPARSSSWLKVPTSVFTFKTLLRHYAKWALTPRSLNVKLGPRRKGHKGRAVWLA